jgi:hypothetical protein
MAVRDDEQSIGQAIGNLSAAVKDARFADAYNLMDDEFRNRVSAADFQKTWEAVQRPLGKFQYMEWNGVRPVIESREASRVAVAKARTRFEKTNEERFDIFLRKSGPQWKILALPSLFPEKRAGGKTDDGFNL